MDMNTQEKQELAARIREMISLLNSKIEIAHKNGIVVNLQTNLACTAACPPLQAEIYERIDL